MEKIFLLEDKIPWKVKIVEVGEKYGRGLLFTNTEKPFVEFYDMRSNELERDTRGQFVSSYYLSDILDRCLENGLCLDGGVPSWTISSEGIKKVINFILEYAKEWYFCH